MYVTAEQSNTLHEARQRVPRYLFRAFSNGSRDGLEANNALHIHPDDPNWRYQASGDEARTRWMLEEHLVWHTEHQSEFTSWTSSLLCALRHAMRKIYHWSESESDVYIAVLDTSNFAIPVWAATALYDAYHIKPRRVPDKTWWELERHYYLGEYLVRGGINSTKTDFRVASLKQLRGEGLHELLPELFASEPNRARKDLACSIRDDRDALCWPESCPMGLRTLTRREMKLSRQLGDCFAGEQSSTFVFPVAVAFLSLRRWAVLFTPGQSARTELEDEILDELRGIEIPDSLGGKEDFRGVSDSHSRYKPEEGILFRRLCQWLIARSRGERHGDGEDEAEKRCSGQWQVQPPENDVIACISRLNIGSSSQASEGF